MGRSGESKNAANKGTRCPAPTSESGPTTAATAKRAAENGSEPTPSDAGQLSHYVIIRPDLPLGLLAAQTVHAAGESSPGSLPPGTRAVVLAAEASELEGIAKRLEAAGLRVHRVIESDAPYTDQLMALGVEPGDHKTLRRHVSDLPLLRERRAEAT